MCAGLTLLARPERSRDTALGRFPHCIHSRKHVHCERGRRKIQAAIGAVGCPRYEMMHLTHRARSVGTHAHRHGPRHSRVAPVDGAEARVGIRPVLHVAGLALADGAPQAGRFRVERHVGLAARDQVEMLVGAVARGLAALQRAEFLQRRVAALRAAEERFPLRRVLRSRPRE